MNKPLLVDPVFQAVNDMFDRTFKSLENENRLALKLRLEDELASKHWDFIEAWELIVAVTCNFKDRYQGGAHAQKVEQCLRDLQAALENADSNVAPIPHELDDPE